MRDRLIRELEAFLQQQDFGRNWDGAYQDVIPAIRRYFTTNGFETQLLSESETASRDAQLVAHKEKIVVRIPWDEDYNGRSLVHLNSIQVQQSPG